MPHLPVPWWVLFIVVVVVVIGTFVLITGRNAEGGLGARTKHGWSRWRAVSQKVADVQARVLLSVFYFTLLVPFAVGFKLFKDPLHLKHPRQQSYWLARKPVSEQLADAHRQF
ncbi:MAG: hypothetical protein IT305_30650 [Chloroflexi bacterium]|nr:hypothetical protein [Chloroflexota bacterium]